MKCFNHSSVDAIGICKNCNKGLCVDCLTEIEDGIACTSTCVEKVRDLNNLIDANKRSRSVTSGAYYRNAIIYALLGAVFLFFGSVEGQMRTFLIPAAFVFFVGAMLAFNSGSKYKK
jgi:hypothetical protein